MGLEEIEEIRTALRKLAKARELNVRESLNSLSAIKTKYDALLQKEGTRYCANNCPEIPSDINNLLEELTEYNS